MAGFHGRGVCEGAPSGEIAVHRGMASNSRGLWLALAAAAVALAACGGGGSTLPRASLPTADESLVRYLPSDAFVVGRLDGAAMRALPAWPEFDATLEREDPQFRTAVRGTDVVYGAVGGLIDAPPVPSREPDADGNWPRRLAWSELAEGLGGKIPMAVAVVRGPVAALCATLLLEVDTREAAGLRYGSKEGVTIATRGSDICLVTFEPVFSHLVEMRSGVSPAARRLASLSVDGNLGVAVAAWDLDAPAYRQLVDVAGTGETSERGVQYASMFRRIYGILSSGITSVEWRASFQGGQYSSVTQVHASDTGRGVMWREVAEIYVEIFRVIAEAEVARDEAQAQIRHIASNTHVDERPDGFVVETRFDEETVASFFRAIAPTSELPMEAAVADASDLMSQLSGSANEVVAAAEPRLGELSDVDGYQRATIVASLAASYRTLGRFDDARRLLADTLASMADDSASNLSHLWAEQAELELVTGHAGQAESIAAEGVNRCLSDYCGAYLSILQVQLARAVALRGNAADALSRIDAITISDGTSEEGIIVARGQLEILIHAGRSTEAAAAAHVLCATRTSYAPCGDVMTLEAEALARGTGPLDAVTRAIESARNAASSESTRVGDERRVQLAAVACVARATRSAASAESRAACADALVEATQVHGESHPVTTMIRLDLARTTSAARDAATTQEQLARVDAALANLGPDLLSLRTVRASFNARPTGRRPR